MASFLGFCKNGQKYLKYITQEKTKNIKTGALHSDFFVVFCWSHCLQTFSNGFFFFDYILPWKLFAAFDISVLPNIFRFFCWSVKVFVE